MVGDGNRCRADVVTVIGFRQLVTETFRVAIRACLSLFRGEWRIHGNANDVISRWYNRLTIATVEHEILSRECETIGVGPARSHTLVSGNPNRAAIAKLTFAWWNTANRNRVRIRIEHAEPLLCGAPNLTGARIDEFVQGVVPEVVMVMANRQLKQTIIQCGVLVGIAHEDVLISSIRRHDSEAHELAQAGGDLTFDSAARICRN